jgi:hypothetical protein
MSLPIKETPILYGKDAERLIERMEDAKNNPVSQEEWAWAFEVYLKMEGECTQI